MESKATPAKQDKKNGEKHIEEYVTKPKKATSAWIYFNT